MRIPGSASRVAISIVLAICGYGPGYAQTPGKTAYPAMAPAEQYLIANRTDEIALARSAAPPSISGDAQILVLSAHGYESAVTGKNGFVCFVQRSWAAGFDDPDFWNPRLRGPNCFNSVAARSELPEYLKRTEWVLSGATREQLIEKTTQAVAAHLFAPPEAGAFSFMMSKDGYLGDSAAGPWLPHVMLFVPHGQLELWGANKVGSPIMGQESSSIESTVLFIPVRAWSDGSSAPPPAMKHSM